MKKIILATLLISQFISFATQDATISAFSSSYKFESFKQYGEATKALMKVYDINSYVINLRLGWLTYLNGEHTASIKYYNQAINLKPKSIEALMGKTYPLAAISNWGDLKNNYLEILKVDPSNQTANYRLAEIHFNRNENKVANEFLDTVLTNYPFDYYSNVLMAKIKTKQGEISKAKAYYNIALLSNPDDVEILKALVQLQ